MPGGGTARSLEPIFILATHNWNAKNTNLVGESRTLKLLKFDIFLLLEALDGKARGTELGIGVVAIKFIRRAVF